MVNSIELDNIKKKCDELGISLENIKGQAFNRSSYKRIMDILSLDEWKNNKYKKLLCSNTLQLNVEEIKDILNLEYWNKLNYSSLLTSNIWNSNSKEIKLILSMPEWDDEKFRPLLTSNIWKSNSKEIKKILSMPGWKDERFKPLLTSTIWTASYKNIKNVLAMEEWDNPRYSKLLTTNILMIKPEKIRNSIKLSKHFNIDKFMTVNLVRKPLNQVYAIGSYLIEHNIPLVDNMKLHTFFSVEGIVLKRKYNIDIKKLVQLYPMPNDLLKERSEKHV